MVEKERGLVMVGHSVVIGVIIYALMMFVFGKEQSVAESQSITIAAVVLVYMIVFGHSLPKF